LLSPRTPSKLDTYWGISHGQPRDRGQAGRGAPTSPSASLFIRRLLLDIGVVSTKSGSKQLLGALGVAAIALTLAVFDWRFVAPVRAASPNAAIEREGPEASREIGEEDE